MTFTVIGTAQSQEVETKIRVPQCGTTFSGSYCACKSVRCLSRDRLEQIRLVIEDYKNTKSALEKCQGKVCKECDSGMKTWKIVLITVGVGVAASVSGYLIGEYL